MDLKSPLAWAKEFIGYCWIPSLTYTRNITYITSVVFFLYMLSVLFLIPLLADILHTFGTKHTHVLQTEF